jgi:hypothetical protein
MEKKCPDPGYVTTPWIIFPKTWHNFFGLKILNSLLRIRIGDPVTFLTLIRNPGWITPNRRSGMKTFRIRNTGQNCHLLTILNLPVTASLSPIPTEIVPKKVLINCSVIVTDLVALHRSGCRALCRTCLHRCRHVCSDSSAAAGCRGQQTAQVTGAAEQNGLGYKPSGLDSSAAAGCRGQQTAQVTGAAEQNGLEY